jgi:hypothetical protein
MSRHRGIEWAHVQAKLEAKTARLWSLSEMERTGGEPDVPAPPDGGGFMHPKSGAQPPSDEKLSLGSG